ncbi:alpha/beta hydrolase [Nocardioides ungokensis]|uniref:alpha/beta hydrolase n=1 Tax=Nocardioides ungokensis TaxID=1643322 RepID=UPI001C609686|nr:alpha/beta hydrolase [Nocardioides ungokensis]
MATTPTDPVQVRSGDGSAPASGHIGRIVAGSLATGLVAALLLAAAPFISPGENDVTGAVLCGFAVGWAMLAILSSRSTDQPQRWAAAPALFMGLSGLLLIAFGGDSRAVLNWAWPPALLALSIWMGLQAHRHLRSPTRRWLLYPVIALMAVVSVGGGYETVREHLDASRYPMSGQLIDVGGHRLHLSCTGSGSPTVVLQPGGGDFSSVLAWIAPAVAADTRVCVYDRAGRGWSDPAGPQDANRIASDLHTLLQRGNVPGPYVLPGHSFGGLYVLTYADRYPSDVAGLVLIDSTNPGTHADPTKAKAYDTGSYDAATDRVAALGAAAARVGLVRLVGSLAYGDLPPQSRDEVRAKTATADYASGWIDEFVQANASGAEAAMLTDFGDKPLVVLTAGADTDATHDAAQNKLATLSTNTSHRVVEGASHPALIYSERYAKATTQAILDVVTSLRNNEPLAK